MKLSFLGEARAVVGSIHLIEVNGRSAGSEHRNLNLPFDAQCANALILSHAHIDHAGNVAPFVRGEFVGNIHCTPATRDLAAIMLRARVRIQEKDVDYMNKIRAREHEPHVRSPYTFADADQAIQYPVGRSYHRQFDFLRGVRATYFDAGHILGSAFTVLEIPEVQRNCTTRLQRRFGQQLNGVFQDARNDSRCGLSHRGKHVRRPAAWRIWLKHMLNLRKWSRRRIDAAAR